MIKTKAEMKKYLIYLKKQLAMDEYSLNDKSVSFLKAQFQINIKKNKKEIEKIEKQLKKG